ncbi:MULTISPECIES: hypothetical protein [unclassified Pseudoalteromonas]|uniref:hypothetical protein n=1 Tax=unclassified Pseudoalteromonas TaxID=194690 RepID=UPI0005A66020|nr:MULTISPECIES: hypothetical protein [unclassified Pseudoalteromonas]
MKLLKASIIAAALTMTTAAPVASAGTGYWYVYASKVNGFRTCAQYSPGSGWYKASSTAYTSRGACNYYGR